MNRDSKHGRKVNRGKPLQLSGQIRIVLAVGEELFSPKNKYYFPLLTGQALTETYCTGPLLSVSS